MDPRWLARSVALVRVLLGAALIVVPERLTEPWVGRDSRRRGAKLITRCLGARDLALGAGALAVRNAQLPPWLAAAIIADMADLVTTLAQRDTVPSRGRLLVLPMAAGAVGADGLALAGLRGMTPNQGS